MQKQLVSASWLKNNSKNPNLVVLDATIPVVTENAQTATKTVISGAHLFDLKKVFSDTDSNLPNTIPTPKQFEAGCKDLGISSNSIIVIYDDKGIYSSPRAWFLFKIMGHDAVAVLDGRLPEWIKHKGSCTTTHEKNYPLGNFKAIFDQTRLKNDKAILQNINTDSFIVMDARSEERFLGQVPEPRADLKRGHIPNSCNMPFTNLLQDGKFRPTKELKEIFENVSFTDKPLIFSCGSGITACILLFAAAMVLKNELFLYDGSWSEWGMGETYPVA